MDHRTCPLYREVIRSAFLRLSGSTVVGALDQLCKGLLAELSTTLDT